MTKLLIRIAFGQVSLFFLSLLPLCAQQQTKYLDCSVLWNDSLLVLENAQIQRKYNWNNGLLQTISITNKATGKSWALQTSKPDFWVPGMPETARESNLEVNVVAENPVQHTYLRVVVTTKAGLLQVKRIFKVYPQVPAIACDFYLQGVAEAGWQQQQLSLTDLKNIEDEAAARQGQIEAPTLETLGLPGKHWRLRNVEFFDVTDRNNTLIDESESLLYIREKRLRGNLLFAEELADGQGIFLLKESPAGESQLAYPGSDFVCKAGEVKMIGLGLSPGDLQPKSWVKCYSAVTGVFGPGEYEKLAALRSYQEKIRRRLPARDDMILMNTWGDRSKGSKLSEKFAIAELEAGKKLGISHFQLDAGWYQTTQPGAEDFWKPHKEKFPNGLTPVVAKAKSLGIEVGLWFTPHKAGEYQGWQKDAEALYHLYQTYGIKTFKVDLVDIKTKLAEENLRKMMDTLQQLSQGEIVLNLDITAGKRYSYHYFNHYGNFFLENRYTDWFNYYPHWTLRNLWMLSKYVPPQILQAEFLNKWRNPNQYDKADKLAPKNIPFDYIFALTMMAQPLAWFEASQLPAEAFAIAPLVKAYRERQADLHAGFIFPVGEEPSGRSWTGFQSIRGKEGYLLVFRENNDQTQTYLRTWLPPRQAVKLTALQGHGKSFKAKTDSEGRLAVRLPSSNSFALYHYQLK